MILADMQHPMSFPLGTLAAFVSFPFLPTYCSQPQQPHSRRPYTLGRLIRIPRLPLKFAQAGVNGSLAVPGVFVVEDRLVGQSTRTVFRFVTQQTSLVSPSHPIIPTYHTYNRTLLARFLLTLLQV